MMKRLSKSNTFQHNFHQYYTFPRVQETQKKQFGGTENLPLNFIEPYKLCSRGHPIFQVEARASELALSSSRKLSASTSKMWMMSSLVIWRKNEWSVEVRAEIIKIS